METSAGTSSTATFAVLPSPAASSCSSASPRLSQDLHAGGSRGFGEPCVRPDGGTIIAAPWGPMDIGLRRVANNGWVREPFTAVSGNLVSCHRFLIKNS